MKLKTSGRRHFRESRNTIKSDDGLENSSISVLPISNRLRSLLYSIGVNTVVKLKNTSIDDFSSLYNGIGLRFQAELEKIKTTI